MRLVRIAALLFVLLLTASPARADDPISATIASVDDASFPEVTALVTVVDSAGRPVLDLTPAAFSAEETGRAASVARVGSVVNQQIGVAVVLTVDVSGSMLGTPIAEARNAAGAFVQSLQPVDQAAVVSFGSQVAVRDGISADRNSTLAAIGSLTAAGNTALYSAVVDSIGLARTASLPRKAIVLLSDGQDFGGVSRTTREQALTLAADARIPIYAIGLGAETDREFLESLARASGGAFLQAPDSNAIADLYTQVSQILRSQYVVTLRSTARAEEQARSLRLTINAPPGSTTARVDYTSRRPPVAVPPPEEAPAQAPSGDGGGSTLSVLLLALLAAGLLAGGGHYLFRWRRDRRLAQQLATLRQRAAGEASTVVERDEPQSQREVSLQVQGPGGARSFLIQSQPVTIGAGPGCQVRLSDAAVADEQARVWSRDGKLVFHQLSPQHASRIGGQPVSWVILEDGDEVEIGAYRLRVVEAPAT